jgi:hypothetical protein
MVCRGCFAGAENIKSGEDFTNVDETLDEVDTEILRSKRGSKCRVGTRQERMSWLSFEIRSRALSAGK